MVPAVLCQKQLPGMSSLGVSCAYTCRKRQPYVSIFSGISVAPNRDVSINPGISLSDLNLLHNFKKYSILWESYHYLGNYNSDQRQLRRTRARVFAHIKNLPTCTCKYIKLKLILKLLHALLFQFGNKKKLEENYIITQEIKIKMEVSTYLCL